MSVASKLLHSELGRQEVAESKIRIWPAEVEGVGVGGGTGTRTRTRVDVLQRAPAARELGSLPTPGNRCVQMVRNWSTVGAVGGGEGGG